MSNRTSSRKTVPLTEVLDFREGPGIMARDFRDEGVPLLRLAGLKRGASLLDGCNYLDPEMVNARWAKFRVEPGDVLLSTSASLGEVAVVKEYAAGAIPYTGIIRFRPRDKSILPCFIEFALRAPSFKLQIEAMGVGSVMRHFGPMHLRQMTIELPQPEEQIAISNVLTAFDDKIAVNDRISKGALALGDACFTEVVQTCTASRSTLAELAAKKTLSFGDGYRTKRSEHGQPGLPILRVAEVMNGRIEPDFVDFVADSYRSAMGGKVSQAGDVILTSKGTVGRVAAITAKDPAFVYSPQLCYFRVLANSPLPSSYIYFWLRSSDFWQQAKTRKSQTDMADYLSLTDIRKLTIPIPSPESNQHWSPALSSLLARISACHEENRTLTELRDTLLPKLMSGQIRARDAEKVVEDVT
jgi:type I restriction enzyme, S subunit